MLTHGNLLVNLRQVAAASGDGPGPEDVGFGVLPLFHIFGLNVVLGMTLATGAAVVLIERLNLSRPWRPSRSTGSPWCRVPPTCGRRSPA
ncbi:MAG: AMP-binding protein [Microthrixaceae bacterium]|nr:AMP-binding protein [Microthrixaceae bacterium]